MAKEMLWDDAAFKRRVRAAVKRKGISLVEALTSAGASREYLNKTVEDRNINTILNLAQLLDVPTADLLGLDGVVERERVERDRLRRLAVAARMMATQLVALVCLAGKEPDIDPVALMKCVLDEIEAAHGGKGQ